MDNEFKKYFFSFLILLILLIVLIIRFPIIKNCFPSSVEEILVSESLHKSMIGLLIGLLSATLFSFFNEYLPGLKKKKNIIFVLVSLMASIVDSYDRCRVFGHETSIKYVKKNCLEIKKLRKIINTLHKKNVNFLKLKFGMETADSRLEDFRNSLSLTVWLDPQVSFEWLNIIDKVKLLSNKLDQIPEISGNKMHLISKKSEKNPIKNYHSDLIFRTEELFESFHGLLILIKKKYGKIYGTSMNEINVK
jgi:hypothetical protein